MPRTRTYLDASVLIAAVNGNEQASAEAMALIAEPNREFAVSEYLRLETLPKYVRENDLNKVAFIEEFFRSAVSCILPSMPVLNRALQLSKAYNVNGIDALHLGAAEAAQAQEIFTRDRNQMNTAGVLPVLWLGPT
jgi:predicted nucleic acid-binding protein